MKKALLLVALLFTANTSFADPYLFAGAAWTSSSGNAADSRLFLLPGLGYRFSRNVAIEAAYFDPGEVSSSFRETAFAPGSVSVTSTKQELSGARLSLVGAVPVSEALSLIGSVSAYRLHGRQREVDTVTTSAPPAVTVQAERSSTGSDTVAGVGLGASYAVAPNVDLRAMLDWTRAKRDFFGAGQDLDSTRSTSFSLLYRF